MHPILLISPFMEPLITNGSLRLPEVHVLATSGNQVGTSKRISTDVSVWNDRPRQTCHYPWNIRAEHIGARFGNTAGIRPDLKSSAAGTFSIRIVSWASGGKFIGLVPRRNVRISLEMSNQCSLVLCILLPVYEQLLPGTGTFGGPLRRSNDASSVFPRRETIT